ncbi:MAG: hypothetical protein GY861_16700 [bacterium]|nr:hypothetical protein [bacterium]
MTKNDLVEFRIKKVEEENEVQNKKIEQILAKLNLILGGVAITPFILSLIALFIKYKT